MIFEIASSAVVGGWVGYSYLKDRGSAINDAKKIQRIFAESGWVGSDSGKIKTIHLKRKRKIVGGTEYVYQIPLAFDRKKVENNVHILEDGLNVRHKMSVFEPRDLLQLRLNLKIIQQIKEIMDNKKIARKEIELDFDGMLRIRVYNGPMTDEVFYTNKMKGKPWEVPVGVDRSGETHYHDFEDEPHFIDAGATGGGKSNFLNLLISHLIRTKPNDVKFTLIDLKGGVEFSHFENCKQVISYAEDPYKALVGLRRVYNDMLATQKKLKEKGFKKVSDAGIKERHFVVIDEISEISPSEESTPKAKKNEPPTVKDMKEEAWFIISQLARLGRAPGIRVISATQHPTQDVVPKSLKRNSEGRLCFAVEDDVASRVVLGASGAEDLPEIPGRAIYKKGAKSKVIQTPHIEDDLIKQTIKPHIRMKAREEDASRDTETNEGRSHSHVVEES
jgi:S-DNA-T family DNA segregation ATPase FtsK/SpoIIIE